MKLKSLILNNIQCFSYKEIQFDSYFNCIVGKNGTGKTTIIDSALLNIIGSLPFKELTPKEWITIGETSGDICVSFIHKNINYTVKRYIKATTGSTLRFYIENEQINGDSKLTDLVPNMNNIVDLDLLKTIAISTKKYGSVIHSGGVATYEFFRNVFGIPFYDKRIEYVSKKVRDDNVKLTALNLQIEQLKIQDNYKLQIRTSSIFSKIEQIELSKTKEGETKTKLKDESSQVRANIRNYEAQNRNKDTLDRTLSRAKISVDNYKHKLEDLDIKNIDTEAIEIEVNYNINHINDINELMLNWKSKFQNLEELFDKYKLTMLTHTEQWKKEVATCKQFQHEMSSGGIDINHDMCSKCSLVEHVIESNKLTVKIEPHINTLTNWNTKDHTIGFQFFKKVSSKEELSAFIDKLLDTKISNKELISVAFDNKKHREIFSNYNREVEIFTTKLYEDFKEYQPIELKNDIDTMQVINEKLLNNINQVDKAKIIQVGLDIANSNYQESIDAVKNQPAIVDISKQKKILNDIDTKICNIDNILQTLVSEITTLEIEKKEIDIQIGINNKVKEQAKTIKDLINTMTAQSIINKDLLDAYIKITNDIISSKLSAIAAMATSVIEPVLGFRFDYNTTRTINKSTKNERIKDVIEPVIIKEDGNEYSLRQLSSGQSIVVQEAVALTLCAFTGINFRIVDEVFDHLDVDIAPFLAQTIPGIAKDLGVQLIVTSHNENLIEYFPNVIEI